MCAKGRGKKFGGGAVGIESFLNTFVFAFHYHFGHDTVTEPFLFFAVPECRAVEEEEKNLCAAVESVSLKERSFFRGTVISCTN